MLKCFIFLLYTVFSYFSFFNRKTFKQIFYSFTCYFFDFLYPLIQTKIFLSQVFFLQNTLLSYLTFGHMTIPSLLTITQTSQRVILVVSLYPFLFGSYIHLETSLPKSCQFHFYFSHFSTWVLLISWIKTSFLLTAMNFPPLGRLYNL